MQIVTYAFYFHRNHNLLNQVQTITVEAAECWILYNKKNQSTCSRIVFSHCKWKFGLDHLQSSTIRVHFHTSHLVFKSSLISTFLFTRKDSGIINISQEYTRKCYTLQEKHEITISLRGYRKFRAIYLKEIYTHMLWMVLY